MLCPRVLHRHDNNLNTAQLLRVVNFNLQAEKEKLILDTEISCQSHADRNLTSNKFKVGGRTILATKGLCETCRAFLHNRVS